MVQKNEYYLNFNAEQLLASKEVLKSMPIFYNKVYFSKKYVACLWSGATNDAFSDITLMCKSSDITQIRQIIKNNFLYLPDWDSKNFIETGDYGFSFILGNIKYNVVPFEETNDGYHIMSYDVLDGKCNDTNIKSDKKFFLDSSINENGEIVRSCEFNLEDRKEDNTKSFIAPKKVQVQMGVYGDNRGYAMANTYYIVLLGIMCALTIWMTYFVIRNLS